jgi:4-hydroxybenzoate polyprenyltransferase
MASAPEEVVRPRRRVSAAIALFFIAPFVAEYLLGDLSLKLLPGLIALAPMYGGAAVLIREYARHKRRGWHTILCLGAAYALLEVGLVTQSLFIPTT